MYASWPVLLLRWTPLRVFALYRIVLAGLFIGLFFTGAGPHPLGSFNPTLYAFVSLGYGASILLSLLSARYPAFAGITLQAVTWVCVDIIAITLLMHASGGLSTGFGILLVISIAGGSLLVAGRLALLFAACAALAVLLEGVYSQLYQLFETTAYTQAGLLGAAFFATALVTHSLAQRLRETERRAEALGLDVMNLEQMNSQIIQHLSDGVIVVDSQQRLHLINQIALGWLARPRLKVGTPLGELCPSLAARLAQWQQAPRPTPYRITPQRGGREFLVRFSRLGAEHGRYATLILLADSSHVLQQAQQMKLASLGQLTASIAHEIRNPLGAISHAAQLLEESELLPTDRRLLEIITSQSERLNRTIQTVLQLSRRAPPEIVAVPLAQWLRHYIQELTELHPDWRDRIHLRKLPNELQVPFDVRHLRQVVDNLCQNALFFSFDTDRRPLPITVRAERLDDETNMLSIEDQGPGIDPEHQRHIFEPFFTTRQGGTGLGLYIARELCETNGAQLEYITQTPQGSCFRITFAPL